MSNMFCGKCKRTLSHDMVPLILQEDETYLCVECLEKPSEIEEEIK